MWMDPGTARVEMARRYEFVSEGAQTARWLGRVAGRGFRACRWRLQQSAGEALIAWGTRLRRARPLNSVHS